MKDDFDTPKPEKASDNTTAHPAPILTVDVEKYQAFLDDADMTEAQKDEFLQALWSIIVSFVDMGFGVHPLQEVCGNDTISKSKTPKSEFDVVSSEDQQNSENHNEFST